MIAADTGTTVDYPIYGYTYDICTGEDTNATSFGASGRIVIARTAATDVSVNYWPELYPCPHCDDYLSGRGVCFTCCNHWNPSQIIFRPREKTLFSRKQIGIRHKRRSGNKHHDRFPKEKFA